MPSKKKNTKIVIIGIIVLFFICAGVSAYLLSSHFHKPSGQMQFRRGNGNFSFNNETLSQVSSYLNNNTNPQDAESYCQQNTNLLYCRYYCMRVNPDNQVCSQLPKPQYPENYTGGMPPQ